MILICKIYRKIKSFLKVNWIKTVYINFKMLPFADARHFPIIIFGKCSIQSLTGKIIFRSPIEFGMLGLGQRYEVFSKESGKAELNIKGNLIIKNKAQFGYDYKIFIKKNATLTLGDMSSMASQGKIICTQNIVLGDFCRFGSECQIIDTNFHNLKDVKTNKIFNKANDICLGNFNFISNRVTVLGKTITSDYCTVASNSLLNKDYSSFGENVILGGVPAKLAKENIVRDWETEKEQLENYLTIRI